MLSTSDIHRSIAGMTINLHKQIERRTVRSEDFQIAEREFQTQKEVSGTAGTLPAESILTVNFNVSFVADAGDQRDSTLDRPHFRHGWEKVFGVPGLMPYVFLDHWIYDDDFNFTGAALLVGVHYPAYGLSPTFGTGIDPTTPASFKWILHAAFQGFCVVWDPDGPLDGGGIQDNSGAP